MGRKKRFRVVDAVVILVVAALVFMLWPAGVWPLRHENVLRVRCKNRLRRLGTALQIYVNALGDGRFYPYIGTAKAPGRHWQNHGANFLVACYWAGTAPSARLLICPMTADDNEEGRVYGDANWGEGVDLKPGHCSYAALIAPKPGECYRVDNVKPDDIIACDGTDRGQNNHLDDKNILRADGSVEFIREDTMKTLDQPPYNGRVKD